MDIYDDIINLPRHESKTRRKMTNAERAAQFAPFAALTGYDGVVAEAYRITDGSIELSEDAAYELNIKLDKISKRIDEAPRVVITYFIKDLKKEGGAYVTVEDRAEKIDEYERILITQSAQIPIKDIISIDIYNEDYK
ncbi:MAG: hypothetical protein E7675_03925 [Ruminococcaceae bacterium]|nr:hypothetical protein [Oscillospiraceae bacterium]